MATPVNDTEKAQPRMLGHELPKDTGVTNTPRAQSEFASDSETINKERVPGDLSDAEAARKAENAQVRNPREAQDITNLKWYLTCVGLYLGALLYGASVSRRQTQEYPEPNTNNAHFTGLDTTIAADVQASVYESLGHIENLPWVGLGFPMASVAVIMLLGRAYGLFNIKWMLISSIFTFEVGSAVCGAAPTSDALIVGRVIAGMGGAGMYLG
jgi:hypothetical protein